MAKKCNYISLGRSWAAKDYEFILFYGEIKLKGFFFCYNFFFSPVLRSGVSDDSFGFNRTDATSRPNRRAQSRLSRRNE